jgi:hypothetical protein
MMIVESLFPFAFNALALPLLVPIYISSTVLGHLEGQYFSSLGRSEQNLSKTTPPIKPSPHQLPLEEDNSQ